MDDELAALYAPFGLRITAGDITLRLFRDADLPAYAELISSRLFADETAPHVFDWWTKDPDVRLRSGQQFLWQARAGISPASWTLTMGVFEGAHLIGSQDVSAKDFAKLRVVDSGSYLRLDAQGRGVGTLMRQMMLVLAFDHLGAIRAESSAVLGNGMSIAVSKHCGYHLDGMEFTMNGQTRVELQRVAVTPETFIRPDVDVQVHGVTTALLEQLGASPLAG
ncbi:MAG: GNAT family protein [Propionibacteriaceae bacterium]|nr:GNAT family protein [Propionibacteriaceae bacterium]